MAPRLRFGLVWEPTAGSIASRVKRGGRRNTPGRIGGVPHGSAAVAAVDNQGREMDGFARGDLGSGSPRFAHVVDLASEPTMHFEPGWLVGSGLLYLVGLLACGRFFELILRSSPTPVNLLPGAASLFVSHLGKYVPGKAMVVIVRAGMVVPFGAGAATAAIATFYETLVMMASGGLIAAAGFAIATGSGASAGLETIHVTLPFWGPAASALPPWRLGGPGYGVGVCRCDRASGLQPFGGTGQPTHSRGWPGGDASDHGRLMAQGLLWTRLAGSCWG